MCESIRGHIVDPNTANDDFAAKSKRDRTTHQSYQLFFGEKPPVKYWGSLPLPKPRKRKQVEEEQHLNTFTITVKTQTGKEELFTVNKKTKLDTLKCDIKND